MVFHSASTVRSAASRSRRLSFQTARPIGFRWTVRRQIEQGRTAGLNCLAHAADLVRTEVVQHDHVAGRKRRREERLDIDQERRSVDGSVEHEGCQQAGGAQAAEERCGVPVPVRYRADQALALRCPAPSAA